MNGKKILITGASRGIGRGTAEYLLSQGAEVVLVARNKEKLIELEEQYPDKAHGYPYDLTDLEHIEEIFRFCVEKVGKLDGMFHAAGLSNNATIKSLEVDEMKSMFDVNYFSSVQLGKCFMNQKYSQKGSGIVYMSSLASFLCEKGMSQYCASKAAVNAFVSVMSKEGVKRRIRVNAIAPAYVDTEMAWGAKEEHEDFDEYLNQIQPYGMIPVCQIANLAEFLLSARSSYITGAIIPVSGGYA